MQYNKKRDLVAWFQSCRLRGNAIFLQHHGGWNITLDWKELLYGGIKAILDSFLIKNFRSSNNHVIIKVYLVYGCNQSQFRTAKHFPRTGLLSYILSTPSVSCKQKGASFSGSTMLPKCLRERVQMAQRQTVSSHYYLSAFPGHSVWKSGPHSNCPFLLKQVFFYLPPIAVASVPSLLFSVVYAISLPRTGHRHSGQNLLSNF